MPITEFRRLRALERAASQEALEEAEDTAAWQEWERREAAGLTRYVPADEVRRHASPEALVAAADLAGLADRRRTRPAELG